MQGKNGIFHIDALEEKASLIIPLNDVQLHNLFWVWLNAHEVFASGIQSGEQFIDYHFNFEAGTSESRQRTLPAPYPLYMRYGTFAITSDTSTEIYLSDGPVIYDRIQETHQSLRPAYASAHSVSGGLVYLSDKQEWVITKEEGLVSSGGSWLGHIGVMRIDGTQRRDLTNPLLFAEWLPPQVNLANLPSPIYRPLYPNPQHVLKGNEWILGLDWSPDGNYLASQYRDDFQWTGHMALWTIEASESTILYPLEEWTLVDVVWEKQMSEQWFPTIIPRAPIPRQYVRDLEPWDIGANSTSLNYIYIRGVFPTRTSL